MRSLRSVRAQVIRCRKCPRLVRYRQAAAEDPPRRYLGEAYWAAPLPGFGDPKARLLIVGLAPAAHGGNRTGRMFTGNGSGQWLARALFETGFASQPVSSRRRDGFALSDAYCTAAARCCPPANKPTSVELARCQPYLEAELRLLAGVRVIVALGQVAWHACLRALASAGQPIPKPKPRFAHGATVRLSSGLTLVASYHPSQQNTFTGKLTRPMLCQVFARSRRLIDASDR
ncbi:MAG: uracil-DNA glycosylase [Candidatus Methylomirabilia bacterium]